jgi:hypothetical protein
MIDVLTQMLKVLLLGIPLLTVYALALIFFAP